MFRDTGQESFEKIPVAQLCEEIKAMTRERVSEVHFKWPPEQSLRNLVLECRKIQILQILTNLIRNACEAVEKTPNPLVRLDVESEHDSILFSITDNGPGVPREVQERLLRPDASVAYDQGSGKRCGTRLKNFAHLSARSRRNSYSRPTLSSNPLCSKVA